MDDDLTLHKSIVQLAQANIAPGEIEQTLRMPPYTIHIRFHKALMLGYSRYFRNHEWDANMNYKRQALIFRVHGRLNKAINNLDDEGENK